jgi:hypothetical protein
MRKGPRTKHQLKSYSKIRLYQGRTPCYRIKKNTPKTISVQTSKASQKASHVTESEKNNISKTKSAQAV